MSQILNHHFKLPGLIFCLMFLFSCEEDPVLVPDNNPPDSDNVPTVLIENYINRIFIDLIGREPLDAEMDSTVNLLKNDDLSFTIRRQLIEQLQTDTSYLPGDSSYQYAYYNRFYESTKVRMIEGLGDKEILDEIGIFSSSLTAAELTGDSITAGQSRQGIQRLQSVLAIQREYRDGLIEVDEVFRRLSNNSLYDEINMNTFNFINATFDNLYLRFPTQAEFDAAWEMVQLNNSSIILGQGGQNKGDYLEILTTSREFYEGMINWAYLNLLQRMATSEEVASLMQTFYTDHDFREVQISIMITNEYANF